ncbi:MAG: DUF1699 family protein [Methanotrichaceae archaeon]
MRLRIVSERIEIPKLNPDEKMIHLDFKASNVDILNLMQRCPRLRVIHVSPSYRKAMSNALQVFLDMQGIELLEGDIWDSPDTMGDFGGYLIVDDTTLEEIRVMAAKGLDIDEVTAQVQKKIKVSSDLIAYIVRISAAS